MVIIKVAYGVNFFGMVFPLPCFHLTRKPMLSVSCLKGLLMKNKSRLSVTNVPSQQCVKYLG